MNNNDIALYVGYVIIDMGDLMTYTIVSYGDWSGNETAKHCFGAKTKRQVVGLMKTIMDNFDPVHVDILLDDSQNDLNRRGII